VHKERNFLLWFKDMPLIKKHHSFGELLATQESNYSQLAVLTGESEYGILEAQ
jgi:tellurite resistance-related uncharacterized protein